MAQTLRHRPVNVILLSHGVFVLESRHAPGFRMACQSHDFLEIFYVLEGQGTFHLDGREYPCGRDDVVVVPVGWKHRIEDDPTRPLRLYGICVAPQVWQAEPSLVSELPGGPLPVSPQVRAQLRADLRRLRYEQTLDRQGSRLWIVAQTLQLLVGLVRECPHQQEPAAFSSVKAPSSCFQAVNRYLSELPHRFFEATDLDRTAAELGMSRRRFTQLFRAVAGVSWSHHLARLRIDYACQLLCDVRRSIIAVAFECGFEDLSSFYRAFKRHKGVPPDAWRRGRPPA